MPEFIATAAARLAGILALVLLMTVPFAPARGQVDPPRPRLEAVVPPASFLEAVEAGTRTLTGRPGERYWQNGASYTIEAVLSPEQHALAAHQAVAYSNNSPDTLRVIWVHLRQNILQHDAPRNWQIGETTEGVQVEEVRVAGETLTAVEAEHEPGYTVTGTLMRITLRKPLPPGGTEHLFFRWWFRIAEGAPRMGRDESSYFLGYWYPQIAVYDDVRGWDAQQYLGAGEFYMDFADYDVTVKAPDDWLIAATGVLQNPEEVYTAAVRERLARVRSGGITRVVEAPGGGAASPTLDVPGDTLRWHFRAESVRDFAFGASTRYLWDATTAVVGDADGDGDVDSTQVHAFYRPDKTNWSDAAEYGRFTIEYMSELIFPYPYPHATAVDGPSHFGGMEFPMITVMGGDMRPKALFEVTAHEFIHNWWPMIVSTNEKRHMWMDEGLTHYATGRIANTYFDAWQSINPDAIYRMMAGSETEIMRHGDRYPNTGDLLTAMYPKAKISFDILSAVYGQSEVDRALAVYSRRWAFRHSTPWDFFATFEEVLEDDLDWLWTSWFFETWTLDQAVADVEETSDGVRITIRDEGRAPMPVPIEVTYADGRTVRRVLPASPWLAGNREAVALFRAGDVERVEIDPEEMLPDVDRRDNVWTAG